MPKETLLIDAGPKKIDESLEVQVSLPEPIKVSEEEAAQLMATQGLCRITGQEANELAKIGIHVEGVGSMKVQKGRAFVTQQRMDEVLRMLQECMTKEMASKKPRMTILKELARSAGYVASKLTESQKVSLQVNARGGKGLMPSQGEDELPEHKPFGVGEDIPIPGATHIHAKNVQIVQHQSGPAVASEKVVANGE